MAGPVTLSDVAREAGVSLATASRAINGSPTRTVGPELRARVLAAAERLRYSPDANAQAMARGRTTSVGLVVHDIADPYFSTIARGVAHAAGRAGLQVILASTEQDPSREVDIVGLLRRQRARAIVIAGSRYDDEGATTALRDALDGYMTSGGAAAVIGQPVLGTDAVHIANVEGARALARAVHERGYRDVAVLGGPTNHLTARERRDAFTAELAALGAPVPDERVLVGRFDHEGGGRAMTHLLESGERPQLVFAVNDVMALGALAAVRAAGLVVPDDLALAGFDDITTLRDVVPGLTTVRIPLEDVGAEAMRLVLEAGHGAPRVVEVPTHVVLRESTPSRT
ncbi:LacI family DNA-binding transcriptional regulator [Cellulomonas sp. PSBB021]|uniref:LacI family DNA-binding transcriptional regulator n=1 Tax=Cellulomonas sp. PSBB021 TaxID=2003551 RepID=UPI000B8D7A4C|nr:LacI family DNA-binding transcriptional regulator [Cellulomonas sp. PSBB021]ASR56902.1 LacI family transcriptional regulator [Cellulomonas sp. PSBB021]